MMIAMNVISFIFGIVIWRYLFDRPSKVNKVADRGECVVTTMDIFKYGQYPPLQRYLIVLKDNGAPVDGTGYLMPSLEYKWTQTPMPDGSIKFIWESLK